MTLEIAFKGLISNNLEWYKLISMTKEDGKRFSDTFAESGIGSLEVKKVLSSAGYFVSESWSKHLIPEIQADAPKQGIVVGDPKKI